MSPSSVREGTSVTVKPVVNAPVWKHLLWGAVAIAAIWALSKIPSTLIVFSMAWLISYLLNPIVDALTGRRLGPVKACTRGQAVAVVALLLLGALVAAGSLIFPQLSQQIERLISLQKSLGDPRELPILLREKAEPLLAYVPEAYREEAMARATSFIQESASKIGSWATQIVKSIGAFLGQLLAAIFLVASAFLVSLYMLLNWHNLTGGFIEKLPRQYQSDVRSLSLKLNVIFGGYLKATILTAIACMVATFVFLTLLSWGTGHSFPYKGLVSFVAGLSYPIPVIGIIATSILGGVLGFVSDGSIGFGVMVLVTINVVNIIIDRTVQPRLMSDAIGVSELFVMFAAFAGGEVAGVWGMLLGIPVAAMGKTLFEWFHHNFLLVDEPTIEVSQTAPETAPAFQEPVPMGAKEVSLPASVVVTQNAPSEPVAVRVESGAPAAAPTPAPTAAVSEQTGPITPPPSSAPVVVESREPEPAPGPAILAIPASEPPESPRSEGKKGKKRGS